MVASLFAAHVVFHWISLMLLDDAVLDCGSPQPSPSFTPLETIKKNPIPPASSGKGEVADIVDRLTGEWQASWIQVQWHSPEVQPELLYP